MPWLLPALLLALPVHLALLPASRLWIEGDSNRNKWSCVSGPLQTDVLARTAEQGRPPAIDHLRVRLSVAGFRCGDEHMDQKLREALQVKLHPIIEFNLTAANAISGVGNANRKLNATGTLSVAGATHGVSMLVQAGALPDGTLYARGGLPLEMPSYGVKPPTAFLGLIQSKDRIVIHFDLRARVAGD